MQCHVLVPFCAAGSQLQHKVSFVWVNQEDEAEVGLVNACKCMLSLPLREVLVLMKVAVFLQETALSNAWYEVLSVLHLMAMLSLSQANLLLLPRTSADGYQAKVSEGRFQANLKTF